MILVCGHNNAWQLTYRFDAVTRGAVNRVHEVHRSAAGKGVNVARVLAALRAPATLLAYLGGPNGARVRQALAGEGIAAEVIDTAADTRTCVTLLETAVPRGDAGAEHRRRDDRDWPPSEAYGPATGRSSGRATGDGARGQGSAGEQPAVHPGDREAGQVTEPLQPAPAAGTGRLAAGAARETRHVTELVEPAVMASAAEQERFSAAYDRLLEQASVVVIAGSAIGGADREVYAEMVRRAGRRGVPTLLDAYHGHGRAALAAAPQIVKINRVELAELTGTAVDSTAARAVAYRELCHRYGVRWVMVSAGAEGMEACDGIRLLRAAAPAVPVVNSIGSGDAASAGVAAALIGAAGMPATGVAAAPNTAPGAAPAPVRGARAALTAAPPGAASGSAAGVVAGTGAPVAVPAALPVDQADLAEAIRWAVACGSANCLTATPGAVTREAIMALHAEVTVTETPV